MKNHGVWTRVKRLEGGANGWTERVKITLWEGREGSIRDMQECTLPQVAVTLFWTLSLNKESCAHELKWEQIKRQVN